MCALGLCAQLIALPPLPPHLPPSPSHPDATLIANQAFHVSACRTRFVSLFVHGIFSNPVTLIGVALALFVATFFVYVPSVQVRWRLRRGVASAACAAPPAPAHRRSHAPPPPRPREPRAQPYFFTAYLAPPIWTISIIFGAFAWSYTEGVKFMLRNHPDSFVARWLAW